eukprot:9918057-Alexandrium_andersonii.AAC.1
MSVLAVSTASVPVALYIPASQAAPLNSCAFAVRCRERGGAPRVLVPWRRFRARAGHAGRWCNSAGGWLLLRRGAG